MNRTFWAKINTDRLEELLYNIDLLNSLKSDPEDSRSIPIQLKSIKKNIGKKDTLENIYTHSKKNPTMGRIYSGSSVQSIKSCLRNYLCSEFCTDIDIVNCHPTIMNIILKKIGRPCPELEAYVQHRQQFLDENVLTKQSFISMIYSGSCFSANPSVMKIHQSIYGPLIEHLKGLYGTKHKSIIKKNGENPDGSFVSVCIQSIENDILGSIISFMDLNDVKIHTLMYDGLMAYKNMKLDTEFLDKLSMFVEKMSGYKLFFSYKDMKYDELPISSFRSCDFHDVDPVLMASKYLFQKNKDSIRYCNGSLWTLDKMTHLWSSVPEHVSETIRSFILNKTDDNIVDAKLASKYEQFISTLASEDSDCRDDDLETKFHNKNKMCFRNGVYDFETGTFKKWNDCDDIFTDVSNNYEYQEESDEILEQMDHLLTRVVNPIYNNDDNLISENFSLFARSLSGNYEDKVWLCARGERDSGKGILTLLLTTAFSGYVSTFATSNLTKDTSGSGDCEKDNYWLIPFHEKRIMIGNEVSIKSGEKEACINGITVKTIASGGDKVTARRLYGKKPDNYTMKSLMILFSNQMPKIDPPDALKNLLYFDFPCSFGPEPSEYAVNRVPDEGLKSYIKDNQLIKISFFHILKKYWSPTKPKYVVLNQNTNILKSIDPMNDVDNTVKGMFMKTDDENDKIKSDYVLSLIKARGITWTHKTIDSRFTKWGFIHKKIRGSRYWSFIKEIKETIDFVD